MYDEISKPSPDKAICRLITVQYNEYYQLNPSESQARDFKNIATDRRSYCQWKSIPFSAGICF